LSRKISIGTIRMSPSVGILPAGRQG